MWSAPHTRLVIDLLVEFDNLFGRTVGALFVFGACCQIIYPLLDVFDFDALKLMSIL